MGMLVAGKCQAEETFATGQKGHFVRRDAALRNWVIPDGAPGPSGIGGFAAEPGLR